MSLIDTFDIGVFKGSKCDPIWEENTALRSGARALARYFETCECGERSTRQHIQDIIEHNDDVSVERLLSHLDGFDAADRAVLEKHVETFNTEEREREAQTLPPLLRSFLRGRP